MIRILVLLLALGASGGAAWLAYGVLNAPAPPPLDLARPPPGPQMAEVLVAARAAKPGEALTADHLAWRDWPEAAAADFIRRGERPEAVAELAGLAARAGFAEGEPVVEAKLSAAAGGVLASMLASGERAVAVAISAERTAGGFIVPGDRVDVLQTAKDHGGQVATHTILSNLEVLAIDQKFGEDSPGALVGRTATLRVDAREAERLSEAAASGQLSLALRASADHGERRAEPAADEPAPVPETAAAPSVDASRAKAVIVRRAMTPSTVSVE